MSDAISDPVRIVNTEDIASAISGGAPAPLPVDAATQTTLENIRLLAAAIKAQTDLLQFNGPKLKTDATLVGTVTLEEVHITDPTTDAPTAVKSDGVDNALVVMQNSQPLPTGAATAALQTSSNALLAGTGGLKFVDEAGVLYGVKHVLNRPRISSTPYLYDIAKGNIAGHTPFGKLGYNGDVGATEEDLITQGGVYPWIPAGGIALDVVSSSANDTLAGSGVQKVKIVYLDTDYSEQSQVINMNGVTPVPLTDTSILRVNSIRAVQVGAGGMSAGNITVENVGGSTIYRQIATGFTRGRGAVYTVPLGKTLYIASIAVSSGYTTSGKIVRWFGRAQVDDTAPTVKIDLFQVFFEILTEDASFLRDFEMPITIPATADLKISAISDGAGSFCSCSLRGWLE